MDNQALIDAVRGHKALWDKQTCEKTEMFVRERMWEDVAKKMGSTSEYEAVQSTRYIVERAVVNASVAQRPAVERLRSWRRGF